MSPVLFNISLFQYPQGLRGGYRWAVSDSTELSGPTASGYDAPICNTQTTIFSCVPGRESVMVTRLAPERYCNLYIRQSQQNLK